MRKALSLFLTILLIIATVPVLALASNGKAMDEVYFSSGAVGTRVTDSSVKEITAVQLLDSSKSVIAEGVLSDTIWTIVLPPETDQDLISRIGASADVFMKIEYSGASLKQEDGYDDAGQESWASGNIICGISVNSRKGFTVTAGDGSTRMYQIAIEHTEPQQGEGPGGGDEPGSGEDFQQGGFSIVSSTPKGGKLLFSRLVDGAGSSSVSQADAGDSIVVTALPDSGYRMTQGSLSYTLAVAGGETVRITGNRFTMPNCDVTVTCQWEFEEEPSGSSRTEEPGITGFVIMGVSGIINKCSDTEYAILLTLPHGTDVSGLRPGIASYGNVTISPESGVEQDFSAPVTYTVTLEDGTVLTYVVNVCVSAGSKADQLWDQLGELEDTEPWWEYADEQHGKGGYPKYW